MTSGFIRPSRSRRSQLFAGTLGAVFHPNRVHFKNRHGRIAAVAGFRRLPGHGSLAAFGAVFAALLAGGALPAALLMGLALRLVELPAFTS